MKLARAIGEQAVHPFLCDVQELTSGREIRFHLAGHSFGCIVAAATIAGAAGSTQLSRPVNSLLLLQGRCPFGATAATFLRHPGKPCFTCIVSQGLVRGPIVTTQIAHDTAVGTWYPCVPGLPARSSLRPVRSQIRRHRCLWHTGSGTSCHGDTMPPAGTDYGFRPGHVYNLVAANTSTWEMACPGPASRHSQTRGSAQAAWNAFLV